MSKIKKGFLIAGSILLVLILFLSIWYFGAFYPNFKSTKRLSIPGLKDGFVPQGICRVDDYNIWLISGYMADGSKSRVYKVRESDGYATYFTLKDTTDEDMLYGHLGGIASNGNNVWIATDGVVLYLNMANIINAPHGGEVSVSGQFDSGTEASFCFANDEVFIVGEFYRKKGFDIAGHEITRESDNTVNHAYAVCYSINNQLQYGLSTSPVYVLSIPDQVQGLALTDSGKIVLSTSYGLPGSKILIYDPVESQLRIDGRVTINGAEVNLFILGNSDVKQNIKAPCMSEGMDYYDGEVHVLFESACKKYNMVTRTRTKNVLSFELN
jgi:hypothetical protein